MRLPNPQAGQDNRLRLPARHQPRDFGAQQNVSFQADFKKLQVAAADFKYLFVTSKRAHDVLTRKRLNDLSGVTLVLLDA